ncbi:hypothetical protein [Lentilactobacillus otakiensis]|uniref:hypothetical protein n=1 Tax=Lentilactobacillus otakiensis TaxID=481720 RepID=UPI003D184839
MGLQVGAWASSFLMLVILFGVGFNVTLLKRALTQLTLRSKIPWFKSQTRI